MLLESQSVLNDSSAGIIFRVKDWGYYAFLLSTSAQAYKAGELSFKLVKKTFFSTSEEVIIPWTRLAVGQIQDEIASGIKLTVECKGDQITLFVDDSQVGQVRDKRLDSGYIGRILLSRRLIASEIAGEFKTQQEVLFISRIYSL